jgi:3-oxoacyl-[acyl-carrier protein] reductase
MVAIDLSGKTALVTGASSGLGAAMAETLARAGAAVVANYHRNRAGAEAVVARIEAAGGRAVAYAADVTDAEAVTGMVTTAREAFGPVTLLVNNAGREERVAPPAELEWEDYQRMIDLNLKSIYLTSRAVYAGMREARWGRIVNIGSVAFYRPFPGSAAYTAAKGAMLGVTRALATEWGRDGITVNLVAPGWVPVERHSGAPEAALAKLVAETPLGRQGRPEEVAAVVLFYCSELSAFVTGTSLTVNGGHMVYP